MIAVRGLAVILAADVDEYSRIIGEDNAGVSLRCPAVGCARLARLFCRAIAQAVM